MTLYRLAGQLEQFVGRLEQVAGRLQQRWGVLTGDPLLASAGWNTEIAGRIREGRGLSADHADRQLSEFHHLHRDWRHS